MSVSRNSLNKAPYYTWKSSDIGQSGLTTGTGGRLFDSAASNTAAIVVGQDSSQAAFWRTTDGNTWTKISSPIGTTANKLYSVAYGNDIFVAVGQSNTIATSPGTSGSTWTIRTSALSATPTLQQVRFVNGYFIVSASNREFQYSSNGISWTASTNTTNVPTSGAPITAATSELGNFAYVNGTYIYTSGHTSGVTTVYARLIQSKTIDFNASTMKTSDTVGYLYMQDLGDGKMPIASAFTGSTSQGLASRSFVNQQTGWIDFATDSTLAQAFPYLRAPLDLYGFGGGGVSRTDNATLSNYVTSTTSFQTRVRIYYNEGFYQMLWRELSGSYFSSQRIGTITWGEDKEEVIDTSYIPGSYSDTTGWDTVGFTFNGKRYIIDARTASNNFLRQILTGTYATRSFVTTSNFQSVTTGK